MKEKAQEPVENYVINLNSETQKQKDNVMIKNLSQCFVWNTLK